MVTSEYGKGSVFTIEVIQKVIDASPIGDYSKRMVKTQTQKEEFKPNLIAPDARILIVDDNEMNLEVIIGLLSESKMKITTALSGQECIACLSKQAYDLVLLDQMMPKMSGTQTLRMIKDEHLADDTPIIALTADAIVGARDSYLKEGFTDYLSKPIMYEPLEALLMKYLDNKLLKSEDGICQSTGNEDKDEKPLVIAISSEPRILRDIKSLLGEKYKGVYVKNIVDAEKYLAKKSTERES